MDLPENKNIDLSKPADQKSFNVPENYFENFPERLMQKIKKGDIEPKQKGIVRLLAPYAAIAAFLTGIYFGIDIFTKTNNTNSQLAIDSSYFQENIHTRQLDEQFLVDYITNDNEMVNDLTVSEFEADDLIDYLKDEDVETIALMEEL